MGRISKLTDFESAAFCERVVFDFRGRAFALDSEGELWLLIRLCLRVASRLFLRRCASEREAELRGGMF